MTNGNGGGRRPPVSVGLPVYNGERYVAEALASLLAQDYTDFELVIGDNGSTDATEEICRAVARGDDRVRYLRSEVEPGRGVELQPCLPRLDRRVLPLGVP